LDKTCCMRLRCKFLLNTQERTAKASNDNLSLGQHPCPHPL
jgi:hypothetical protein